MSLTAVPVEVIILEELSPMEVINVPSRSAAPEKPSLLPVPIAFIRLLPASTALKMVALNACAKPSIKLPDDG